MALTAAMIIACDRQKSESVFGKTAQAPTYRQHLTWMFSTGQVRRAVGGRIGILFRVSILFCLLKLLSVYLVLVSVQSLQMNEEFLSECRKLLNPLKPYFTSERSLRGPVDELGLQKRRRSTIRAHFHFSNQICSIW